LSELTPTRSTFLEIQAELERLAEGYRFLDEKSMLLAHEILRQLGLFESTLQDLTETEKLAAAAFDAAIARHGLDSLEAYPPWNISALAPQVNSSVFLGLTLLSAEYVREREPETPETWMNSPEVHACRLHYLHCLQLQFQQSLTSANLLRLKEEYLRSERRARALDQLIMPQMRKNLRNIEEKLEEIDQEENFSVRNAKRKTKGFRTI
jgi:V/A-type H+-transporting ATPase subunit D